MLKKILIGFIVFFVLFVGAIVAVPFVFKDKINAIIKEQINNELLADIDYGDYDLSIIKSFPDLYFSLENLTIIGRNEFDGDTLASVKEIGIGLELMKFIRGEELLINSLLVDEANVLAYNFVTENGDTIANYDILPPTESVEDTSSLIAINVNDLTINNSSLYFADVASGLKVAAENLSSQANIKYIDEDADADIEISLAFLHLMEEGSGMDLKFEDFTTDAQVEYTGDFAQVISQMAFNSLSFNDGSMQLLNKAKLIADLNVDADLVNNIFTLKENILSLNALKIFADGVVGMPDDNTTTLDLKFNADKSSFKELLSVIPAEYLKDIEGATVEGNFALNGMAKGNLTDTQTPAFDINFTIENGLVQYPDLPTAIEKINLNANVNNKTSNLENTNVAIPNATFSVVDQPIAMSLAANNVLGDPFVDLKVKGKLPLNKVPEFYPLEGVNKIDGLMDADFSFNGLLSDVENEKFDAIDFAGKLGIQNLVYDAIDLPMPFQLDQLNLDFTPQKANLVATNAKLGASDFNANGHLDNLINYVFSGGTIKGDLSLNSNQINLDEILGSSSSEEESSESTTVKVPENIDFGLNMVANKILYDGLEMDNVKGGLTVKDEKVSINALRADMLGGSANIDGFYNTKDLDKAEVKLAYDINKFDIQKTFNQFNTVQAIAPMAKYLTGTVSTDMALTSFLNEDLSLDLNLLSGLGNVKVPYATFTELPMFQKIADLVKIPALKKPELKNAWTILKFEDGNVNVEPFQIKMQDMLMDVEGSNGFDQSINYTMKLNVPSDKFGGAASLANDFLSKQNIPLFNLSVPQNISFHLNVGGTMTDPKVKIVKVTADQSDKGVKEQIKDNVKEQLNDVKEDLQNKAQEELDNAKQKALEEAEKAKQQALDKAKEEAAKAAEKAKQDAKDKIKEGLKGFGFK